MEPRDGEREERTGGGRERERGREQSLQRVAAERDAALTELEALKSSLEALHADRENVLEEVEVLKALNVSLQAARDEASLLADAATAALDSAPDGEALLRLASTALATLQTATRRFQTGGARKQLRLYEGEDGTGGAEELASARSKEAEAEQARREAEERCAQYKALVADTKREKREAERALVSLRKSSDAALALFRKEVEKEREGREAAEKMVDMAAESLEDETRERRERERRLKEEIEDLKTDAEEERGAMEARIAELERRLRLVQELTAGSS